jgi:Glycogen recognition site of AMP-activated protein kinase
VQKCTAGAQQHSRGLLSRHQVGADTTHPPALQYKYVVDGVWRCSPSSPVVRDEDGNLNNVLEVVDPCTSFDIPVDFDPPPSPPSR